MDSVVIAGAFVIGIGYLVWFKKYSEERRHYFNALCEIIDMTRKCRSNLLVDEVYKTAMEGVGIQVRIKEVDNVSV